ncbi:MAG: KUP/HAK/KT family potassium transporter, partial [bacterium]
RFFSKKASSEFNLKEVIKSLGLVFGDIGTSPLYTIYIVFMTLPVSINNVMGVLSLISWTMLLLVIIQYTVLAMNLSKKGEGGTIVLKEILLPLLKTNRQIIVVTFLSYIGISLFFGDGVITPAISILNAVEGLQFIPGLQKLSQTTLVVIAGFIAFLLFSFQKRGTDKVSITFGPIMVIWFLAIASSGLIALVYSPELLLSFSPHYAIKFLLNNGFTGFVVLSEVILCATGGEALYADMGHLGKKPIQHAAAFVFPTLLLSYFGQGAFLLQNPTTGTHILHKMILHQASFLYIPFIVLSLAATVIASQAMISGLFSIVYQGVVTQILPNFKVDYTSTKFRSQIYLGFVNWFLFFAVLAILFKFKSSEGLAAAYGLAATGTMTITGIIMSIIFLKRHHYIKMSIAAILTGLNFSYFCSNCLKIPTGGYWSIGLALIPLSIILIYTAGQRKIKTCLKPIPLEDFLETYNDTYGKKTHIEGTALFFVKEFHNVVDPYIVQTMFKNNIFYEDNIIISIVTRDDPFGVIGFFKGELAPGLRIFEIHMGYMEIINIEKILNNAGINAKVIFYGLEDIDAKNPLWKFFAFIKKITPSFVRFHKLPPYKLHGVVSLVEIKKE